ncbi:MAG: PBP1A family penicillin-binding protein [Deferribacteraceae bacterium]|jgi:penicillin-binding protein 1A|nr:PBP1A family penicillin-binding protein [Deferribacteraceae bacterium]
MLKLLKSFFGSRILRYTVLAVFLGVFAGVSLTGYHLYKLAHTLPSVEEITRYRMSQPSMLYDETGAVIAELGNERRYPIPISKMPVYLQQAVIATEDARFYEHSGVDFLGIFRAMLTNVKSGRFAEGGSTLTQQLVKNIFFTKEKKLIRKYKEAVLAYRLDKYLTKDDILEFYLNYVNFGRGGYGVQAAAVNYFGKNAADLNLTECALLAGIPKAPGIYAPHLNLDRSQQRRNHVLLRMYENGYINEDEYLKSIEEPIVITETIPLRLRHAGYFLDFVLRYLSDELEISEPQNKGLKVYTTLNVTFQDKAEDAVRNNLLKTSKRQGYFGPAGKISDSPDEEIVLAGNVDGDPVVINNSPESLLQIPPYLAVLGFKKAVAVKVDDQQVSIKIDNNTSGVLKLIDNRWARAENSNSGQLNSFKTILEPNDVIYVLPKEKEQGVYLLEQDPPMDAGLVAIDSKTGAIKAMVGGFAFEKTMFNRAAQAKRQVGSSFKPIVYATAIEYGMQPMTKILDAPVITSPNERGKVWRPKNFEDKYYGETTIKEGLTRSRNIITIKIAERLGIRRVLDMAQKFGITSDLPADLSITIGSGSVSLLEMVYAYSVFPNMGTRPANPYFVTKIEDSEGNILYEMSPPAHVRVIRPDTAHIMTDILINVVENGTGARAKAIPRPIGAKTGTTNENRDTWFIGFMPNFVVGVWMGFDEFRELGSETGSQAAAPVWVEFVNSVLPYIPRAVFPVADGVIYRKVDLINWEPTDKLESENISFEPYSFTDIQDDFSDELISQAQ